MVQNMWWGRADGEKFVMKVGRREAGGRKEGAGTKMGSVVPTVSTPDRRSMVIKLAVGVGRMGGSKGQRERPASRRRQEGAATG